MNRPHPIKAPLKGELAGPKGLTEGFCGRYLSLHDIPGEYVPSPLGFPRGEAGFFGNRHFGTDCQKRLMRDGVHRKLDKGFGEWRKDLVL